MACKATLRDAIFGLAVGDALGVPYEFQVRDTFTCTDMVSGGTYGKPAGTWSDDTSMTLATCDSIRENEGLIDEDDIRARFVDWMNTGRYTVDGMFDIGNTCATALREGRGCTGGRSNGNGSLMRIVPLAFTCATDDDVAAVSAITHAHAMSIDFCQRYVRIARRLAAGEGLLAIEEIAERADVPREQVQSSGFVKHTYDAALWCLANTQSYAECVLAAVNLGSDTDTTAAVAGALAGIAYGEDAIPVNWLKALRGKDLIERTLF